MSLLPAALAGTIGFLHTGLKPTDAMYNGPPKLSLPILLRMFISTNSPDFLPHLYSSFHQTPLAQFLRHYLISCYI